MLTTPPYLLSSPRLERRARDIGRDFLEGVGCDLRCIWNAEGSDIGYRDIHGGHTWLNEDRNYLCTSVFSARVSFAGIIILVPRILVAASVYTSITAAVEVAAGDGFIHAADRFADLAAALVDRGDGKSLTLLGVDPSLLAVDEIQMPSTVVAISIYRGPGPLPKY